MVEQIKKLLTLAVIPFMYASLFFVIGAAFLIGLLVGPWIIGLKLRKKGKRGKK